MEVKCPVCGKTILLKKTKKDGIGFGFCKNCWFRGFFPIKYLQPYLKEGDYYICNACGRKLTTYQGIRNHIKTAHLEVYLHHWG